MSHEREQLLMRKPEEEYATFYRALSNDMEDHLSVTHFQSRGSAEIPCDTVRAQTSSWRCV